MAEIIPMEEQERLESWRMHELRKNITIVTNDIFELKYNYKREGCKKMDSVIFGYCDTERRLNNYLAIYREVCKFIVKQYYEGDSMNAGKKMDS